MLRYPWGSTTSWTEVICWSYTQMCTLNVSWNGLQMQKKQKLLHNILKYIFSPITSPKARFQWQPFRNPIKVTLPLPPGQSGLWQAQQSQLSSSLAVRQVDISFECTVLRHWCKGYYPECPSGLANSATCCNRPHAGALQRNESVEKKRKKKTKYFLLNVLPYKR